MTTLNFQGEIVPLQHRQTNIPFKNCTTRAASSSKYVVFEPLPLPEDERRQPVNLRMYGFYLYFPSHMSWVGIMQTANCTVEYEKAGIVPLSFINRDPTQPSNIFVALYYAKKESVRL